MGLITEALEKRFAEAGEQRDTSTDDNLIIAKFFAPGHSATWYAAAYYPEDNTCFGYVTGLAHDEWGYFSITEIEALKIPPFGLPVERDEHFNEVTFKELKKQIY